MLFLCMNVRVLGCSNMSNSLRLHRLWPARLLCPWDSLGKNTGVDCHAFLQDLPDPGIEPVSPVAPALHKGASLTLPGVMEKDRTEEV